VPPSPAPIPTPAPKAAVAVANQLRRSIIGGDLPVGSSLPPENRLVADFDVSRPTLRAALRILESEQLITVRRGSRGGAWVNAPTEEALAHRVGVYLQYQRVTLDEVHRARILVEPPAVGMLAADHTEADLALLSEIAADEAALVHDRGAFRGASLEFHRALVSRCGNLTLGVLASMIHGVVSQHADRYAVNQSRYRHGPERHREHLEVIELIRAGDVAGAEQHWRDHLEVARQVLMREGGANSLLDLVL
jgi:DNA-binding FadR family transcriptional regulator